MEGKLLINGGTTLCGEVKVEGAKNALLPLLAATVLSEDEYQISNYVDLEDLKNMREILSLLGVETKSSGNEIFINSKHIKNTKITHELTQKLRASIFTLGALLGKFRKAEIAYPGGCQIGARPIDIHINGFKALGAKVVEKHGYIYCNGENLKSGEVLLDFPSVGATESLMMCACLLDGETTLKNVAKEPEIVDLQNFLVAMGANIIGAGSDCIKIVGVKKMHGCAYKAIPDRIVAGTYILATAVCGGNVLVDGVIFEHNQSLISFLKQTACQIETYNDKIRVKANKRLSSIENIETKPFPFFPTDLQSQMLVLQSVSSGVSIIQENMFENRYGIVPELKKMGADIVLKGKTALVKGVDTLFGADVCASDLRAGAGLVIAGMKAEGYTTISNAGLIDRGYKNIEERYNSLGADIKRI